MPALIRYRHQVLSLDSSLALTRGNPLGLMASTSFLNPLEGIYTGICTIQRGQPPLIGQIRYVMGTRAAHLTYLLPHNALNSMALPGRLEHLITQAGQWGAFHVVAEVDENSTAFEGMRRAAFSTYAFQRIWRMPADTSQDSHSPWVVAVETDTHAIRSLYQSLVPSLIQPMEGVIGNHPQGLLVRQGNDLVAYAEVVYGPRGVWVQPFIHPSVENPGQLLPSLATSIPRTAGRPVYLCVRSYQAWLETALNEIRADCGARQALMVRHIAMLQRVGQMAAVPNLENSRAETSLPLAPFNQE